MCCDSRAGDIQHMNHGLLWHPALGGESVVRTCVVISSSPQPSSSLCLRHQNLYQHSAGSGIMSLFVSPMSHLVHYEDQDVCHEFCICRNYWPVCCADWVSWPSVPGPPTSLMPPNVPHYTKCPLTTLNWEFMTEKPAKNVKREIQKRYSRRLRWRASVCLPELVLQCLHIPLAWDTRDPGDHTPGYCTQIPVTDTDPQRESSHLDSVEMWIEPKSLVKGCSENEKYVQYPKLKLGQGYPIRWKNHETSFS